MGTYANAKPMRGNPTRRRLLKASAATVTGLGLVGSASADTDVGDVDPEQIPVRTFRPGELRTETVAPTAVPEGADGIRPGSQMFIEYPDGTTAGCTANFVWRDDTGGSGGNGGGGPPELARHGGNGDGGGDLYIGAAGHCFLPADKNASKNAKRKEEDQDDVYDVGQLDVSVCADCTRGGLNGLVIQGDTIALGDVVYARRRLPDGSAVGHDFGLVKIPAEAEELADPSMPQWGGPDGSLDGAAPPGSPVNQYGAGVGNGEVFPTMGSSGGSFGDGGTDGDAWFAGIRASPGDSGSPLVGDRSIERPAAGILTHLTTLGTAGTTIGRCREMTAEDVNLDIAVVVP